MPHIRHPMNDNYSICGEYIAAEWHYISIEHAIAVILKNFESFKVCIRCRHAAADVLTSGFVNDKMKKVPEKDQSQLRDNRTKIILSNSIKCNACGDILESKHVHDYKRCSCGQVGVDGGKSYLRRIGSNYTELSHFGN